MFKWINTAKNAQAGGIGGGSSSSTGHAGPGPSSASNAGLDSNSPAGPSINADANEKRFGMENVRSCDIC